MKKTVIPILLCLFTILQNPLFAEEASSIASNYRHSFDIGLATNGKGIMAGLEKNISYNYLKSNFFMFRLEAGSRDINYNDESYSLTGESKFVKGGTGFSFSVGDRETLSPYFLLEHEELSRKYNMLNQTIGLEYLNRFEDKYQWALQGEYKIFGESEYYSDKFSLFSFGTPFKYFINDKFTFNISPNLTIASYRFDFGYSKTVVGLGLTIGAGVRF